LASISASVTPSRKATSSSSEKGVIGKPKL
jgi:hypothetical protein